MDGFTSWLANQPRRDLELFRGLFCCSPCLYCICPSSLKGKRLHLNECWHKQCHPVSRQRRLSSVCLLSVFCPSLQQYPHSCCLLRGWGSTTPHQHSCGLRGCVYPRACPRQPPETANSQSFAWPGFLLWPWNVPELKHQQSKHRLVEEIRALVIAHLQSARASSPRPSSAILNKMTLYTKLKRCDDLGKL